jgi:hypothetical protein
MCDWVCSDEIKEQLDTMLIMMSSVHVAQILQEKMLRRRIGSYERKLLYNDFHYLLQSWFSQTLH